MLKAYSGMRTREHFGATPGPHVLSTYGTDRSGTKSYRFNSLGFRSEEHDPDAAATIFVCGCSNAFGLGLNVEESWVHQFKLAYAAERGLNPSDVNLLNFSQGAASNDYITRTLLTQCAQVRPDLVIAQFSPMYRCESYVDGQPFCIGTGLWGISAWVRFLAVPWTMKSTVMRRIWRASGHARRYSPESGLADTLRNMLLLQFYCRANGIRCVMTWSDRRRLDDPALRDNPALAPLIALLDRACLCDFAIRDPDILTDAAADGRHPGPATNAAFAARLLDFHDRATSRSS
jgi:hypothetical protein